MDYYVSCAGIGMGHGLGMGMGMGMDTGEARYLASLYEYGGGAVRRVSCVAVAVPVAVAVAVAVRLLSCASSMLLT